MKKLSIMILALVFALVAYCGVSYSATKVGTFGVPVNGTAPLEVDSDGNLTITSDLAMTGDLTVTGNLSPSQTTMAYEISSGQTVDVESTDTGTLFLVTQDTTFILPTAAAGLSFTFTAGDTVDMIIDPDNTLDYLLYSINDTMLDGGDSIKSGGQAGDSVTVTGVSTSQWAISGMYTVWSDNG